MPHAMDEKSNRESIASIATIATIATSVRRKPLSRDSVVLSPTVAQQTIQAIPTPAEIEFVLGPAGVHCWYDRQADETEEASREEHSRYWSKDADDRLRIGEESLTKDARTVQLYACSPSFVTATIFTDAESQQHNRVKPPYQNLIQRFGKLKREYERAERVEQDLSDWITICLVNNISPTDLRISFGPEDGFYAHAPGRSRHRGLPVDLQEILASHDSPPEKVSLGVGSTWWVEWADGKQENYIQQNSYPDLCALLENVEHPDLKRIQLNPARANEFVVEYAHKRFFVRARCSPQDLRSLNNYLKEYAKDVKVVVLTSVRTALGKDLICEPFVLPMYDFESSSIVKAKELKPGEKTEWMEFTKTSLEMTKSVKEAAQAGGACSLM